jgi:hypothetical protein
MIHDEPLFPWRSPADRRRHVTQALLTHPEYSDRRIARMAAVGRGLVKIMRSNMERMKRIQSGSRVGLDGKIYGRGADRVQESRGQE